MVDLLGDGLLQQGAGRDANAVGCRNLDGFAGARVAAGAGCALDALGGEQAGQLQAFAGLHCLDEHVLESVGAVDLAKAVVVCLTLAIRNWSQCTQKHVIAKVNRETR